MWRVPLPQSVRPTPTPSPVAVEDDATPLPVAALPALDSPEWGLSWPVIALGLAALLVLGFGVTRGRRGG